MDGQWPNVEIEIKCYPFWMSLLLNCHPVSPVDLGLTNGKFECRHPVDTRLIHERVSNGYLLGDRIHTSNDIQNG